MSLVDITIPSVGESITEANVGRFLVGEGQWADKGAAVLEIETDKASMEINAPESGVVKYQVGEGDLVSIGATVGSIDTSAEKPAASEAAPVKTSEEKTESKTSTTSASTQKPALSSDQLKGLGPAKRKAAREGRINLNQNTGSQALSQAPNNETRQPMSLMRKKIAERLMHSQQSTASLTTFNEVNMAPVMETRKALKADFEAKFGARLGFMSYFTKAVCAAAAEVPAVTSRIDGDEVVSTPDVNISIAVSTDRGLVVPVLRQANLMTYPQIESGISALAEKARNGQLGIEDMVGGNFTITNGGVFGSLVSTPILNPPQSGILGMHKIEQRPMAVENDQGGWDVTVLPMMYLALTYDHRLVDGKESVTFLVKVKEYLESVTTDQVMKS